MNTSSNKINFAWKKSRVSDKVLRLMNEAAKKYSEISGREFWTVKLMFGKYLICNTNNMLFFLLSDRGRPPEPVPVALQIETENSEFLFPSHSSNDFDMCCNLLGINTEGDRKDFQSFLDPRRK